jgi:metallophosphoesterase superfamily enzyme
MRVLDEWLLTPARAAVHLPTATAVVADVHLGYGEARHRGGDAVPPQGVAAVLDPVRAVLKNHIVRRLVVAGDLFEAGPVAALVSELLAWCASADVELIVLPGNHDRGLETKAPALPVRPQGITLGRWHVVHGDGPLPDGPIIQGHEHPVARWGRVGGACFLVGERRLILPALSPDAAGVNVLHEERWQAFRCCVIAGERVLDFGELGVLRERTRDRQGESGAP